MVNFKLTAAALLLPAFSGAVEDDTCTQFKNIYNDGTELCETIFREAFEVVDDDQPGYTMWFFDHENNPNDEVSRAIFGEDTFLEECHLSWFHKEVPGPEDEAMTECHPWKNYACCNSETVKSADALNEAYGPGLQWDRCGPMSQACERFFVQEACFYECEPAAGLFRRYNDSHKDHPDFNEWQIYKMPIKKSYCDAWYTACYHDYFCGNGTFFGCNANYEDAVTKQLEKEEDQKKKLKISLSVIAAVAGLAIIFACFLVGREKSGKPVFVAQGGTSS